MTATKTFLNTDSGVVRDYPETVALVYPQLVEYTEDEVLPLDVPSEHDLDDAVVETPTDQAAAGGEEE